MVSMSPVAGHGCLTTITFRFNIYREINSISTYGGDIFKKMKKFKKMLKGNVNYRDIDY